jgi:hypothetical protein
VKMTIPNTIQISPRIKVIHQWRDRVVASMAASCSYSTFLMSSERNLLF